MPGQETEDKKFRIDLDHSPENREKVETWCKSLSATYAIAEELGKDGTNPHYQGAIRSELTMQRLRTKLKNSFGFDKEQSRLWSVGQVTALPGYLKYLKKQCLFVTTYDMSNVPDWIPESELVKEKKERKLDYFHQFLEDYQETHLAFRDRKERAKVSDYYKWTVKYFQLHSKIHDRFVIEKFCTALVAQYDTPLHDALFVSSMEDYLRKYNVDEYIPPRCHSNPALASPALLSAPEGVFDLVFANDLEF